MKPGPLVATFRNCAILVFATPEGVAFFKEVYGAVAMMAKAALLVLIPCGLLYSGPLWSQAAGPARDDGRQDAPPNNMEEVIVRGQRLSDIRSAVELARVRVYDIFNNLNSDDVFDVHCQDETTTGTRTRQQVCRPRFRDDVSRAATKAWVYGLKDACGGLSQDCIFSESAGEAKSRAQAEEAWEPIMQKRFALEMARVVAESPELRQAILDYEALERAYDEARRRRSR